MTKQRIVLGLRANAAQFTLLVALNALVGAMVGLERSVLPLLGTREFGVASAAAVLSFVAAFGLAKAPANLAAGGLAGRYGRKRVLVAGWLLALPVPALIGVADSWSLVVAANVLLGASQGLTWSMTVVMKVDLAGSRRRGLALGLNESAGYLGVAAAALASGGLAATFAPRSVIWIGAAAIAVVGTLATVLAVRDTTGHVAEEQRSHGAERRETLLDAALSSVREPVLRACSQAGLVNNLNDALAWALAPLYLAAHGTPTARIAVIAALYPAVWGLGQLVAGWLSDAIGRKPPIVAGMLIQGAALALLVGSRGAFAGAVAASVLLGIGTALVYPTLIAAVSDSVAPVDRAQAIGVYRFWRDIGLVAGALLSGALADAAGASATIAVIGALTAASGVYVLATPWARPIVAGHGGYRQPGVARRRGRFYPLRTWR